MPYGHSVMTGNLTDNSVEEIATSANQVLLLAAIGSLLQTPGRLTYCESTAVGDTSAGNAAACATSQACLYAIVCPPTDLDVAIANTAEVKVATAASGNVTHANAVIGGLSLMPSNYEGIVINVTNTNQLRFASATASTVAKVFAVVGA